MQQIFDRISSNKTTLAHITILLIIWIGIVITNYQSNTFLVGWDNVQVELNFWLNLKRAFSAVWQEFQGVGLVGGHPHAADLPRIIWLFLYSLVLPLSAVRYAYMFTMLIIGPIGMYFLLKRYVLTNQSKKIRDVVSLLGSTLYLLNLGMLQNFYLPLSAFATFYAFLPILIYSTINVLEELRPRTLLLFIGLQVLAAPFAFIPQIFMAYLGVIGIIFIAFMIRDTNYRDSLHRISTVSFSFVISHAYWLFPFIYFTITNLGVRYGSSFNTLLSERFFLQNSNRGGLLDVALLRGAYFDTTDYNAAQGNLTYNVFEPWIQHLDNVFVQGIGYLLFIIALYGIYVLFKDKINQWSWVWIGIFALGFFMLIANNPPTGFIFEFMRDHVSLFKEAFRFPYNKFSIVAMVGLVTTASIGMASLFSKGETFIKEHTAFSFDPVYTSCIVVMASLLLFMMPLFKGHLFYNQVQQHIPQEYFDVFEFFEKQDPNGRIANFPQYTIYGWNYYDWGYHGSGFLWYGIEQPILDRNFDVWHESNEAYYHEITHALYTEDTQAFAQVLDKYDVHWVLLDNNVIAPNRNQVRYTKELAQIIKQLEAQEKVTNVYQFGDIILAKVTQDTQHYFETANTATTINTPQAWVNTDTLYQKYGNYNVSDLNAQLLYPFLDYESGRTPFNVVDIPVNSFDSLNNGVSGQYITLEKLIDIENVGVLTIPTNHMTSNLTSATVSVWYENNELHIQIQPQSPLMQVDGQWLVSGAEEITTTIPITSPQALTLQIGDSYFSITNFENAPTPIGTMQIDKDRNYPITIYDMSNTSVSIIDSSHWSELINCVSGELGEDETKKVDGQEITLTGSLASPCIFSNTNITASNNELLTAQIDFKSKTLMVPHVCFSNEGETRCLNTPRQGVFSKTVNNQSSWQVFTQTDNTTTREIWLTLSLDAFFAEETKDITFSSVRIEKAAPLASGNVYIPNPLPLVASSKEQVTLSPGEHTIKLYIPKALERYNYHGANLLYHTTPRNCNPSNTGTVAVTLDDTGEFIQYSAENNGIACNTYDLEDVGQRDAYIFLVQHQNNTGLASHVCLYNHETQKCDTETRLQQTENPDYEYFIQPVMTSTGEGYTLTFSTEAIGSKQSTNTLYDLSMQVLPVHLLEDTYVSLEDQPEAGNIEIKHTTELLPMFYHLNVTVENNPATLIFNQSYEKGWWLIGAKSTHVTSNGWANGWILEPNTYNVYIVYMPQLLQWLGFALLSVISFLLWRYRS